MQPGWQVLVRATPLARPLLEAVQEQIARRGAYPILQLAWETVGGPFAREAPLDLLARPAPLLLRAWDECDAFITIAAPENVRDGRRPLRGAAPAAPGARSSRSAAARWRWRCRG